MKFSDFTDDHWTSAATYSPPWGEGDWKVATVLTMSTLFLGDERTPLVQRYVVFRGSHIPPNAPAFNTKDWAMLCANHFNRMDRAAFPKPLHGVLSNVNSGVSDGFSSAFQLAHVLRIGNLELTWGTVLTLPWYTEVLIKLLAPYNVVNKKPLTLRVREHSSNWKERLLWGTRGKPQKE